LEAETPRFANNPLERQPLAGYAPPAEVAGEPLRPWVRSMLAALGLVLVTLLITAACLTPSRRGMGTHQQLGLPPCSMVQILGLRCPACGMTTSWAYLLDGQVFSSLRANAGGTLLGLTALMLAPWSLLTALRGRWFWVAPRDEVLLVVSVTIAAVTVVDWVVRIVPWH
jgi:hypothetical protein